MFIEVIKNKVKSLHKKVLLVEDTDERILEAAQIASEEGIAAIYVLSSNEHLKSKNFNLINPNNLDLKAYQQSLYELRKHRGMSMEEAGTLIKSPLYLGTLLLKEGLVDAMVAGALHATPDVLRAGLQVLGTASGIKTVSSFFLMEVPNSSFGFKFKNSSILGFSDCALIQYPNEDQLANIAMSSAHTFTQITGEEAVVAMLSHSTYGSAKHEEIQKVKDAIALVRHANPSLKIDGEFQLDAAIVESVGKMKAKGSNIAGKANVLIFPNIDAGNIGYKLVQRFANANAYGPLTQGLNKPLNDLSRGASVEDIVGTIALSALQA